ncbi:hypothetical protein DCAR_0520051 [Daucus carota subsp. sativus]|uniref:Replication protein A 70 kDa DNA-binding subunit B/D first OB fold domain-containing protein n=1 Tax=Daucus carota subsp. sativus TaxID=79200 RepID=A0A164YB14_DAUCS|nr:hypothetical protein DCAR_0520051 [Daucus carota subsp. sativus]
MTIFKFQITNGRFRLCTLCSDETGSIAIIFPDCEITRMIEKTVIDLHADCLEEADEDKFPEMLNWFLKQKYTMNLYINDDNIENGSTVYNAKQILQAQEKGDSFDPNKPVVVEAEDVSMANVSETQETAHPTPNTGNYTNTKSRARKITEPLAYNPTDTSAIRPEKNVKVEKVGNEDHKIKVRIMRLWRGSTKTGEEFKNFNLILLDHKGQRIHAFVPTKCADDIHNKITVGRIFSIKNFAVQLYNQTDKFRFLRLDKQLVFSKDTNIQELADDGVSIPQDAFDFYDHSQLEELSNQTRFLAEVVGIIKNYDKVRELTNRHGQKQKQAKFIISDGSSAVNVTFWDNFGVSFDEMMTAPVQKPVIIIISGCKGEVDISNTPATKIYLNHKHHSVTHLRRLLLNPEFAKRALSDHKVRRVAITKVVTVAELKSLGITAIEFKSIDKSMGWSYNACTSCEKETKNEVPCHICESCNRFVPYPQRMFKMHFVAEDSTGQIQVVLADREVRTIIGRRALDLAAEMKDGNAIPESFLSTLNKDYNVVVQIREYNIAHNFNVYWATNICNGFVDIPKDASAVVPNQEQQTSQATSSTYNAQGISDITLTST